MKPIKINLYIILIQLFKNNKVFEIKKNIFKNKRLEILLKNYNFS